MATILRLDTIKKSSFQIGTPSIDRRVLSFEPRNSDVVLARNAAANIARPRFIHVRAAGCGTGCQRSCVCVGAIAQCGVVCRIGWYAKRRSSGLGETDVHAEEEIRAVCAVDCWIDFVESG